MTKVTALCGCGESDRAKFYVDRRRGNGVSTYCKACTKAKAKARWAALTDEQRAERAEVHRRWVCANRERVAGHKRLAAYGLTDEAFAYWLAKQDGRCAICEGPMTPVCVDHDHETGAVRGLLCGSCNKAIGFMDDDPERLLAAARYLKPDIFDATYEVVSNA